MNRFHITAMMGLLAFAATTAFADAKHPQPQATPTPAPTMAPAPGGAPAAAAEKHGGPQAFVVGDFFFKPSTKNAFDRFGNNGKDSYGGRAAISWPFGKIAVMAEGTYVNYQYNHLTSIVGTIGPTTGFTIVPAFFAHDSDWSGRLGIGVRYPRVFIVADYEQQQNNYGYPHLQGFGYGFEKLPDFDYKIVSFFGSFLYYPQFGAGNTIQYGLSRYQAGLEFHPQKKYTRIPIFIEVGYIADYAYAKKNAPTPFYHNGVFAGFGFQY